MTTMPTGQLNPWYSMLPGGGPFGAGDVTGSPTTPATPYVPGPGQMPNDRVQNMMAAGGWAGILGRLIAQRRGLSGAAPTNPSAPQTGSGQQLNLQSGDQIAHDIYNNAFYDAFPDLRPQPQPTSPGIAVGEPNPANVDILTGAAPMPVNGTGDPAAAQPQNFMGRFATLMGAGGRGRGRIDPRLVKAAMMKIF